MLPSSSVLGPQVGRALTALAAELELPVDVADAAEARQRLEETFGPDAGEGSGGEGGADGEGVACATKHRPELRRLWARLVALRGGGERGLAALDACLAQSSALPAFLLLRLQASRASTRQRHHGHGKGSKLGAAEALLFIEKLDLFEKTCLQDRIEVWPRVGGGGGGGHQGYAERPARPPGKTERGRIGVPFAKMRNSVGFEQRGN